MSISIFRRFKLFCSLNPRKIINMSVVGLIIDKKVLTLHPGLSL